MVKGGDGMAWVSREKEKMKRRKKKGKNRRGCEEREMVQLEESEWKIGGR